MTSGTTELLKELLAFLRQPPLCAPPSRPIGIGSLVQNLNPANHPGMLIATVFRAEQMVSARLCCGKPDAVIMAGNHIVPYAECRNRKAMNHVFGSHRELHRLPYRHMKRVDFAAAVRIL